MSIHWDKRSRRPLAMRLPSRSELFIVILNALSATNLNLLITFFCLPFSCPSGPWPMDVRSLDFSMCIVEQLPVACCPPSPKVLHELLTVRQRTWHVSHINSWCHCQCASVRHIYQSTTLFRRDQTVETKRYNCPHPKSHKSFWFLCMRDLNNWDIISRTSYEERSTNKEIHVQPPLLTFQVRSLG